MTGKPGNVFAAVCMSCVACCAGAACLHLQSTLEGQVFDVVLLDESSQMTEPTSLVREAKPNNSAAGTEPHRMHHGNAYSMP